MADKSDNAKYNKNINYRDNNNNNDKKYKI